LNPHPEIASIAAPCAALSLSMLDRLDQYLKYWALTRNGEIAFRFLWAGREVETLTFGELDAGARGIAAELAPRIDFGQPVLLAYAPGLEFIRAYFGCLYAGLVPVPLELPRNERGVAKLHLVAAISHARWMLSDNRSLAQLASRVGDVDELPFECFATDRIAGAAAIGDQLLPQLNADALALLQFTSGSTGTPKGVMVTHRQLLANQRAIARAFAHDESTVVVGWLPFFHDMGLIGNVLQPVFLGHPCVLMSPQDFIQSPVRWLQAISDYRATTSGGPNFSYALCASKVPDDALRGLDLSTWRLAFNGAEPVRSDVMQNFYERFATYGFKRRAFFPCYGLAEATLFVCGRHWDGPSSGGGGAVAGMSDKELLGCPAKKPGDAADKELPGCAVNNGSAAEGCEVLIVDPEKRALQAEGVVGEIWVSGSSVASGYWNEPLVGSIFHSECVDWPGRRWLRTGDLGFMRNRELYPTGRLTDLIVVRGVNHYPAEIEATVQRSCPGIGLSSVAAFALEGDVEPQLVIALEVSRGHVAAEQAAQLLVCIRGAIAAEHGLTLATAVLLAAGSLPRTSGGKLRRGACRDRFACGDWNEYRLDRLANTPEAAPLKAG
jgi:acyl-CoA synthetase (AMP-forming)/AMP-acid ligase II